MIDLPAPVESLPIGGFQPLNLTDFAGTPSALVLLRGCSMRCPYCHNRALWTCAEDGADLTEAAVLTHLRTRLNKISGVIVSGGEPTIHARLPAFLADIKNLGLRVKLNTNGSRPDALRGLLDSGTVDYVALDVKSAWSDHDCATGIAGHAPAVAESLGLLRAWSPDHSRYELRTTVCAGLHDDQILAALIASLCAGERWVLQAYQPVSGAGDSTRHLAPPDPALLTRCIERAQAVGIACSVR